MSDPTTNEPTSTTSGRASDGRFAKGNQFGPGNPFARKCAAFRAALMDTITEQDIKDIAAKLRDDAKAGDKAAVKLLFQYVIGKPQPAVDPDTLDVQKLRGYMAGAVPPEVLEEMQRGLPLSLLLKLWPFFLFAQEQTNVDAVEQQADAKAAKQQRRAERARQKAERRQRRQEARRQARQPQQSAVAPSINGENGHAPAVEAHAAPSINGCYGHNGFAETEESPSLNGDNGGMIDFINRWLRGRPLPPNGAQQK